MSGPNRQSDVTSVSAPNRLEFHLSFSISSSQRLPASHSHSHSSPTPIMRIRPPRGLVPPYLPSAQTHIALAALRLPPRPVGRDGTGSTLIAMRAARGLGAVRWNSNSANRPPLPPPRQPPPPPSGPEGERAKEESGGDSHSSGGEKSFRGEWERAIFTLHDTPWHDGAEQLGSWVSLSLPSSLRLFIQPALSVRIERIERVAPSRRRVADTPQARSHRHGQPLHAGIPSQ